jgi:hypothetical protein
MRIRDPKTTALIFASGKMVCTGAKSEEASRLAARKYARIIQKLNFPAKFTDFKIQNIVGSCDVKFPIRLEGLAYAHNHYCSVRDPVPVRRVPTHLFQIPVRTRALPRADLSNGTTEGRVAYLRVWQDCAHRVPPHL